MSTQDIATATMRLAALQAYRALVAGGKGTRAAARQVGHPFHTIYNWGKAYDAKGFDGLLPQHKRSGRKPTHQLGAQEMADVKALILQTNRTATAGSIPEAARAAIKRGLLSEETAEMFARRMANGQSPLLPSMVELDVIRMGRL